MSTCIFTVLRTAGIIGNNLVYALTVYEWAEKKSETQAYTILTFNRRAGRARPREQDRGRLNGAKLAVDVQQGTIGNNLAFKLDAFHANFLGIFGITFCHL